MRSKQSPGATGGDGLRTRVKMLFVVCIAPLIILSSLCSVTFCLYIALVLHIRWKYKHIPGAQVDSFLLGHLPSFKRMHAKGKYVHDLFLQWAEEHGPLVKIFVLHRCLLVPTGQAILKEILTKSKYPKSKTAYRGLHNIYGVRLLGKGLVCETDYRTWHKRRWVFNPAFQRRFLKGMMDQFNQMADEWIELLKGRADGKTVFSLSDYCCKITLDIASKLVFGKDMDSMKDENSDALNAVLTVLEGMACAMLRKDPLARFKPSKRQFVKDVKAATKYLRDIGRDAIRDRRRALASGDHVPEDVLTTLVQLMDIDPDFTEENVIDDFLTFVLAGQETTANALAFLFCEIGRHPHVMERLKEEVDQVIGNKAFISFEDLSELQYVTMAWKETLRLYPPATGTARDVPHEVHVDGFRIPAGSFIVIPFYVIHRNSSYYEDPHAFIPERLDPSNKRLWYTYLPFSLGQRACIGQHFAHIEAKVLLCKFLQNFTYELDPNQSFEIQETATLKPKGGTMVTLSLR